MKNDIYSVVSSVKVRLSTTLPENLIYYLVFPIYCEKTAKQIQIQITNTSFLIWSLISPPGCDYFHKQRLCLFRAHAVLCVDHQVAVCSHGLLWYVESNGKRTGICVCAKYFT